MENSVYVYGRLISSASRLDVKKLVGYIQLTQHTLDNEWLNQEVIKAKKGGLKVENMHRLIYLWGCYNSWVEQCIKTGIANITLEIIELMKLASNLEAVKKAKYYEKMLPKLKIKEGFDSAKKKKGSPIEIPVKRKNTPPKKIRRPLKIIIL